MEKEFEVLVKIKISSIVYAQSKEDAINIVKENFRTEYNLDLYDEEIVHVHDLDDDILYEVK